MSLWSGWKFSLWSLNKLQWITLFKKDTDPIPSILLWYDWSVWWEHDPTSITLEASPTAWHSSSACCLALHVRAISARAWQLVLQMKSTWVYSASLMACFPLLPKEQPSSLKGTCCLLIFNLLQAYLGVLPLSSAAQPGPPACSCYQHCRGNDTYFWQIRPWLAQCAAVGPRRPPAPPLPDVLCHSQLLTSFQQNIGLVSDELHCKWHRLAKECAGGTLQSNSPVIYLFSLSITAMGALKYLWYPVFICDQRWLSGVCICWSRDGVHINVIYMEVHDVFLTRILTVPKDF